MQFFSSSHRIVNCKCFTNERDGAVRLSKIFHWFPNTENHLLSTLVFGLVLKFGER